MKQFSAASDRNSEPIATILDRELPEQGRVLEIASGTGQHAVFFARRYPQLLWMPSDMDDCSIASIRTYAQEAGLDNLSDPISLDTTSEDWGTDEVNAIVCVNMVHISPWQASEGLVQGAAHYLADDGPLILYGPYLEESVPTALSNLAFDDSLKARNPQWGLRKVEQFDALARSNGLARTARYEMPANNLMLIYRRSRTEGSEQP